MKTKDILPSLGFNMNPPGAGTSDYGVQKAEPYDVGKDHFEPLNRFVYVGKMEKFCYVTSSIQGTMRKYRGHTEYPGEVGNIYGSGKTRRQALIQFAENFKAKKYNVSR